MYTHKSFVMKKRCFLLIFSILTYSVVIAQPSSKTEPDKHFGKNGTKTTTKTTDESLNEVITIEYKDDAGIVRAKGTSKKSIDNKYTIEQEWLSPSGRTTCKVIYTLDENFKIVTYKNLGYNKSGDHNYTIDGIRNKNGGISDVSESDREIKDPHEVKGYEENFKKIFYIDSIGENKDVSKVEKSPCSETGGCSPQSGFFVAYSYLNGDNGNQRESFPLGGHASFIYNLGPRTGIGLDASLHTKKIGTENFTRSFIMIEGQYVLGDVNNCDRKIIPDIHVLVGLGSEKFGTSKGSGLAFGGGGAITINLSNTIGIKTQADIIFIKFKNTDELNSNIRISPGIFVLFEGNKKDEAMKFKPTFNF